MRVGAAGRPSSLSRLVSVLVLASATPRRSTTTTSPEAILAVRASRRAERRISVGIFLSYFRGVGPKGLPPPFHCVARIEPWRARPVPFCFQGFLPPPDTSLRPLVSWVPAGRQLLHHALVQEWHAHGAAEDVGGQLELLLRLALRVEDGNRGHATWPLWLSAAGPWSASRSCAP